MHSFEWDEWDLLNLFGVIVLHRDNCCRTFNNLLSLVYVKWFSKSGILLWIIHFVVLRTAILFFLPTYARELKYVYPISILSISYYHIHPYHIHTHHIHIYINCKKKYPIVSQIKFLNLLLCHGIIVIDEYCFFYDR